MELLFKNQKRIEIKVPLANDGDQLKISEVLKFIRDEVKPDRPELFMQNDTM